MICRNCGWKETKVIDSRDSEGFEMIRRRRECIGCGFRFTTFEITAVQKGYYEAAVRTKKKLIKKIEELEAETKGEK